MRVVLNVRFPPKADSLSQSNTLWNLNNSGCSVPASAIMISRTDLPYCLRNSETGNSLTPSKKVPLLVFLPVKGRTSFQRRKKARDVCDCHQVRWGAFHQHIILLLRVQQVFPLSLGRSSYRWSIRIQLSSLSYRPGKSFHQFPRWPGCARPLRKLSTRDRPALAEHP